MEVHGSTILHILDKKKKRERSLWINKKSSTDNGLRLVQYHSVDQQLIKRTEATKQNQIGKNKNPKIIIYVINYKLIRCYCYFLQSTKCELRELNSRACPFFVYWKFVYPACCFSYFDLLSFDEFFWRKKVQLTAF